MIRSSAARSEVALLGVLLVADVVFYAVVIPRGISDPAGFGLDQGLPPSFSARLAAVLLAIVMLWRVVTLMVNPAAAESASDGDQDVPVEIRGRNLVGVAAAMLYAFAVVPLLGFYVSGFFLTATLMRAMGETRWVTLAWQPVAVVGLIWVLFDRIFSIRLPVGSVFGG